MGIYKKGGHWYIDYRVGGRRRRERVGPSRRMAETVLGKRQVEIAEGRFLDRKSIRRGRFDDFAVEYQEYSRANKRNFSRECYLMRHLQGAFGNRFLSEITSWMVERYKASRRQAVAPATVNRELTVLKHMVTKDIEWGRATTNPVKAVKSLREANTRVRFLTEDEQERLLTECSPTLRGLVLAALHSGFRRGELLSLRWADVDFRMGLVTVQAAYTKNGERRSVPMSRTIRAALEELRRNHPQGEYVFENFRGGRYLAPRNGFEAAVRRANVQDFHFHDLRHTFASRLVMAGVDLRTVQELLGHKTISMTFRYSHLSPSHRAKAAGLLDGVHLVSTRGAKVASLDATSGHHGGHSAFCPGKEKQSSS